MQLDQHFADQMGHLAGPDFPQQIALAVSGGGDSMAMLHLAAGWARRFGVTLRVVTVDHGLRAESNDEARLVADEAAGLGLHHTTLSWSGWDGQGNLQDAARRARADLIAAWAGPDCPVLMAHTRDDQAETLLMRLARGSGVDGLAAIRPMQRRAGLTILRPLLDVSRADLRHYLRTLMIPFVDDPSNDDNRFARVRMRKLIGAEGLDIATLANTAKSMARAAEALGRRAFDVATEIGIPDPVLPGCVCLDRAGFDAVESETQLRILAGALQYVASATYRPRLSTLEDAADRLLSGGQTTMHGGVLIPHGERIIISREPNAAQGRVDGPIWDQRWHVEMPLDQGLEVGALMETGLAQIPELPQPTRPRIALAALPALWQGHTVVGCPALGFGISAAATIRPPGGDFPQRLLAH